MYDNPNEISSLRTADVDFLVPLNQKFSHNVDIAKVFSKLGFEPKYQVSYGFVKYVHPDMEIEFLVPETGKPKNKPYELVSLKSNAQRLRYLDILTHNTRTIAYKNFEVTIPEPAAFVLNKIVTSIRRHDRNKKAKDIRTAKELGEFILRFEDQKELLINIFRILKPRLQKGILKEIEAVYPLLYKFLSSI